MKVVELFAGVGGFRLGLEQASDEFQTVLANQWEPNKKKQYAYDNYCTHWKEHNCINEDIALIKSDIPEHELLVGGFPCQPFSVARTSNHSLGIEDTQKGILWFYIRDILELNKPKYVLLENVDRLLKSPAKMRGRDYGVILKGFMDLGYSVQWRVINAAEYGNAQRRRRTFIFASLSSLPEEPILNGVLGKAFPIDKLDYQIKELREYSLDKDIQTISDTFKADFGNAGYAEKGKVWTTNVLPIYEESKTLREICFKSVEDKYYIHDDTKWKYLKGSKRIPRVKPNGEPYFYTEGAMDFPDSLDKPGRTMLTSEGSVNRSSHAIKDEKGLRILTPVECERLNGFPDRWTEGMPERMRYFCMGNALVVPLITRIGKEILEVEHASYRR